MGQVARAPLGLRTSPKSASEGLLSPQQLDDAFACEYVLGVLSPDDHAAAEARIKQDQVFAGRVARWQRRMAEPTPQPMPQPMPKSYGAAAPDVEPTAKPVRQAPETRILPPEPLPRRASGRGFIRYNFRFLVGALLAAAMVLATMVIFALPRAQVIVTLAAADNRLSYEVQRVGDAVRVVRTTGLAASTGRVHELWLITVGQGAIPLGLLEEAPLVLNWPEPPADSKLAVSLEPAGGSTTGRPSGPLILMEEINP